MKKYCKAVFVSRTYAIGLLLLTASLLTTSSYSQLSIVVGGTGPKFSSLYNTYGPFRSVPANFFQADPKLISNRHAYIYHTASLVGVPSQATIDSLAFYKLREGVLPGNAPVKIYLKNVPSTNFGAGNVTWDAEVASASLVFNGNAASIFTGPEGFKNFIFSTPFIYAGGNLAVFVEYIQETPTTTYITWQLIEGSPALAFAENSTKYDFSLTATPPATLSSSANTHPVTTFFYTPPPVMPLQLTDFKASYTPRGVNLQWATVQEKDIAGFNVEKCIDLTGNTYAQIAKIDASNNPAGSKYGFTDSKTSSDPVTVLYRIKILHRDGTSSYSKVLSISKKDGGNNFKAYPNPAKDFIQVKLPSGSNEQAFLTISDATGKVVSRKAILLSTLPMFTSIDLSDIRVGYYRLMLQSGLQKWNDLPFLKL